MDKTKKIWSIILLCLQILLVACMVLVTWSMLDFFDRGSELDGTAGIAWLLVVAALVFAIPTVFGFFGSAGLIVSIINIKIAQSKIIKVISICFSVFYGIILLASVLLFVNYGFIMHG